MTSTLLLVDGATYVTERARVDAAGALLAEQGPLRVAATTHPGEVDEVVATLDADRLVVCGGDGSVHLAVDRLDAWGRRDVPVGIVPLGTGNDLARGMGLPLDPEAAARRILRSTPSPTDLLRSDDGRICVNALHAGMGADAADLAQAFKGNLGTVAYRLGALAAGAAVDGWELSVEVDGRRLRAREHDRVLMVAVMNGPTFGGGTPVAPDARPDDGRLDVVLTTASGPAARAAFATRLRQGEHVDRDDVARRTGVSVVMRGEPIPYDIDGELEREPVRERRWQVEPGAWRLVR